MNITEEIYEKVVQAQSEEELFALAAENGIEVSQENAEMYFALLNPSDETNNYSAVCKYTAVK